MNQPFYTIDQGNTNQSVLHWEGDHFKETNNLQESLPIYAASVAGDINIEHSQLNQISYEGKGEFGKMHVNYGPTVGIDRLLFAYGVSQQYPKGCSLLIDSGTYLTIDFLNKGSFEGGVILPGKKLFNTAYHQGTNLHVPKSSQEEKSYPFKSTKDNLEQAFKLVLLSTVSEISKECPFTQIFVTGGDGEEILHFLKKRWTCHFIKHAVHRGIAQYVQDLI